MSLLKRLEQQTGATGQAQQAGGPQVSQGRGEYVPGSGEQMQVSTKEQVLQNIAEELGEVARPLWIGLQECKGEPFRTQDGIFVKSHLERGLVSKYLEDKWEKLEYPWVGKRLREAQVLATWSLNVRRKYPRYADAIVRSGESADRLLGDSDFKNSVIEKLKWWSEDKIRIETALRTGGTHRAVVGSDSVWNIRLPEARLERFLSGQSMYSPVEREQKAEYVRGVLEQMKREDRYKPWLELLNSKNPGLLKGKSEIELYYLLKLTNNVMFLAMLETAIERKRRIMRLAKEKKTIKGEPLKELMAIETFLNEDPEGLRERYVQELVHTLLSLKAAGEYSQGVA